MLPRFHAKDFLTVGHYLGVLLVITGTLMLVPALVAALFGEYAQVSYFIFGGGLTLMVGALMHLLKASRLDRRRSLLLCGFGWVLVGFFAAVPLYLSGDFDNFLGAFFDSVSAITSTGVTCLADVEHMAYAQSTWRTVLSLAGGQAIIITALYLGFFGDGGYSASENARARRDSITAALRSTGRLVWTVMAFLVLVGVIVLAAILAHDGMSIPEAILNGFWLSGNAFSTGSFVPHNSSLIFYHSTSLNAFIAVLMILGSINFAVFALSVKGASNSRTRTLRNSELRSYAIWLFMLTLVVSAIICREGIFTSMAALFNHSTFMVITAATTSGMQTFYPGQMGKSFPDGALIIIMAAMFIGGCSCSTAGGLKMFRALQVLRWFGQSIQRSLFPDSVQVYARYQHFGTKRATSEDAMLAMIVTTLFIIAAALGAAAFIAHGYDAMDAICESISYVTNTGVGVEVSAANMESRLMLIAMLMMWAGRLEFIVLIAAFASVVTSARPYRSVIPDGVMSSRKSQKRERRESRLRHLYDAFMDGNGAAKVVAPLVVLALAGTMAMSPLAFAAGGSGVSYGDDDIQLSHSYKASTAYELQNATSRMDGSYVKVTGEVVGYLVDAGTGHYWVNIQDEDGSVIAVYAREGQCEKIASFGSYGSIGDTISVRGMYNQACKHHAGELEIHAFSLVVDGKGSVVNHDSDVNLSLLGVLMLIVAGILLYVERAWRGRPRLRILGFKL